jgi:hypothetical protein
VRPIERLVMPAGPPRLPAPPLPPDRVADVFVESRAAPAELARDLDALLEGSPLRLIEIGNRGAIVHPGPSRAACVDQFRCRLAPRERDAKLTDADLLDALRRIGARYRWMEVIKSGSVAPRPSP